MSGVEKWHKTSGLVDINGGLVDALRWVSVEANLAHKDYEIRSYAPPKRSLANKVIGTLGIDSFKQLFMDNPVYEIMKQTNVQNLSPKLEAKNMVDLI